VSRTFENTCAVIFVNAGGPESQGYAGLSQVAVPLVGSLGKLESSEENMSIVDLDMEILREAEDNYKVREDLASDDWHYDYRHGKPRANL
jgi:predicted amidohydrolase